ncbi:cytochrome c [Dokdonia sinensis]|uniref:Cytochrome c n=1 Tax=Dokdonia sinensis TaxID=2479847 RepID=A0A3M0GGX7_9FLAO|nr:cytochrome c [Dokdonia sinensis]RMB63924.1 cytochrome c [Dokdonia sinensis]
MKFIISSIAVGILSVYAFAKADSSPHTTYTTQTPLEASITRGAEVYNDFCIQCHLGKGEGVEGTFPPLGKSDWLTPERYKEAIQVVKYGQNGEITVNGVTYNGVMANLGLYDDEVADVMNYIMNNWGNTQEQMVTEEEVKGITE